MKRRRHVHAFFLLSLTVFAVIAGGAGCGPNAGESRGREMTGPVRIESLVAKDLPPLPDLDLAEVGALELEPLWESVFSRELFVSLSFDGSIVVTSGSARDDPGWRTSLGFEVFDRSGTMLWSRRFREPDLFSCQAQILSERNLIVACLISAKDESVLQVYDLQGNLLLEKRFKGSIVPAMSDDGERLAVVDYSHGRFYLLEMASGRELAQRRVEPPASARFCAGGQYLLVVDERRAALIDRDARIVAEKQVDIETRCHLEVSPNAEYVALTTGKSENMLYVLALNGAPRWEHMLFAGGSKQVVFSPDSATLVVYDVGERGGIYSFESATGRLRWRRFLRAAEGRIFQVKAVRFSRDRDVIVANYAEHGSGGPRGYYARDSLVFFSPEGGLLAGLELGREVRAFLSGDAAYMALTSRSADGEVLRFYDLRPLLSARPGVR